ncbi:MAG: proprotein convertase P-domain-containing protein, partial [Candidatus Hydrogenedentes bacterium]|nr:proprotein convertase P-domain-containing protein [Candidatus Hydrogenedentota bacterium]
MADLYIPDSDALGVSDTITSVLPGTVLDVDIYIDIAHSWVGDLTVVLEHVDSGTTVVLIDRPGFPATPAGCGADNFSVVLDDAGAGGAFEDVCVDNLSTFEYFTPANPLSAFNGLDQAGEWRLTVSDVAEGDDGSFHEWCLSVKVAAEILTVEDLQKIGNDPEYPLDGHYYLSQDIDAGDTLTWNSGAGFDPIGTSASPFTGTFDGNDFIIHDLFINRPFEPEVGLFGRVDSAATITGVGILDADVTGDSAVAPLVGFLDGGTVTNCYATGVASGSGLNTGGLIGFSLLGTVAESYADTEVIGNDQTGGLIGFANGGALSDCYASGSVSGDTYIGGLCGALALGASASRCYATGFVDGTGTVGGLVGSISLGAWVTDSFWDPETTGQATSAGADAGAMGLSTAAMKMQSTFQNASWDFGGTWEIVEDVTYPFLSATRPQLVLIDSYSELANIGMDIRNPLDGHYIMTASVNATPIKNGVGFIPIGTVLEPFTGIFEGLGNTITGLYVNQPGLNHAGLFGVIGPGAVVRDLGLRNVDISGNDYVGALA